MAGFLDSVTLPGGQALGSVAPATSAPTTSGFLASVKTGGSGVPTPPAPAPSPGLFSTIGSAISNFFSPTPQANTVSGVAANTLRGIGPTLGTMATQYGTDAYNQAIDFGSHPINSIVGAALGAGKTLASAIPNFLNGGDQEGNNETTTQQMVPAPTAPVPLTDNQKAIAGWNSVVSPSTAIPVPSGVNQNSLPITPHTLTPQERSQNIADALNTVSDAAGIVLSPVSAAFGAAQAIPGLKQAADVLNVPATLTGLGGAFAGGAAIDTLRSMGLISQQTADILKVPVQNASSLAAQIFIGGRIYAALGEASKMSGDLANMSKADATYIASKAQEQFDAANKTPEPPAPTTKIPVSGESVTTKVPIANDYRQGADIQVGRTPVTPKSDLPVAASSPADNAPAKAPPGLTYEPIKPEVAPVESPVAAKPAPSEAIAPKAVEPPATVRPEADSEGNRVTKAASDINETLVKQGLQSLTQEQQAKYTTGSYKDSKAQADIMAEQNRDDLNKMATTGKDIPAGVHPQILFNTVRDLALKEKDYGLVQELANSPLATERSEAAGTLGSAGYGQKDNANVVIDKLREAQQTKLGDDKQVAQTKTETKAATERISKTRAKLIDYGKIMDSLTC